MLSILIPTFNYNTFPLVKELYNQCKRIKNLNFEILVNDDASDLTFENESINKLSDCHYYKQEINQGSSASRNFLIQKATFKWCLFLDDDVWPTSTDFILNYITEIHKKLEPCVIFGGLEYSKKKPKDKELLRWLYGNKHEALSYKKRIKHKPNHFLCSNLLIEKSILVISPFPTEIRTYGYEDLIFNLNIINNKTLIYQLDNSVFHEKLDTSEIFLLKTQTALENLNKSINSGLLPKDATGISILYFKLVNFRKLIELTFKINQKWMERKLISKKTNLKLFNFYRLGYFCSIHK